MGSTSLGGLILGPGSQYGGSPVGGIGPLPIDPVLERLNRTKNGKTKHTPPVIPPRVTPPLFVDPATQTLQAHIDDLASRQQAFQSKPTLDNYYALRGAHRALEIQTPAASTYGGWGGAAAYAPDFAVAKQAHNKLQEASGILRAFAPGSVHYAANATTQAGQKTVEEGHWHTTLEIKHAHRVELNAKTGLLVRRDLGYVVTRAILTPVEEGKLQSHLRTEVAVPNLPIAGAKTLKQAYDIAAKNLVTGAWTGELMMMKSIGSKPIENMNAVDKMLYAFAVAFIHAGPAAKKALLDMFTPAALLQLGAFAALSAIPVVGQVTDVVMVGVMIKTIGVDKAGPFIGALWDASRAKDLSAVVNAGKQMEPLLTEAAMFLPNLLGFKILHAGANIPIGTVVKKTKFDQRVRIASKKIQNKAPRTTKVIKNTLNGAGGVAKKIPVVGGLLGEPLSNLTKSVSSKKTAPSKTPATPPQSNAVALKQVQIATQPNHPMTQALIQLETCNLVGMLKNVKPGEATEIIGLKGFKERPVEITKVATDRGEVLQVSVKSNGKEYQYRAAYDPKAQHFVNGDVPWTVKSKRAKPPVETSNPSQSAAAPATQSTKKTSRPIKRREQEAPPPPKVTVSAEEINTPGTMSPQDENKAKTPPPNVLHDAVNELRKDTDWFAAPGGYETNAGVKSVSEVKADLARIRDELKTNKTPVDAKVIAKINWRNAVKETVTQLDTLLEHTNPPSKDWRARMMGLQKRLDTLSAQGARAGWTGDVGQLDSYVKGKLAGQIEGATRRDGQPHPEMQGNANQGGPDPFAIVRSFEASLDRTPRSANAIAPAVIAKLNTLTNANDVYAFVGALEMSHRPELNAVAAMTSFEAAVTSKQSALNASIPPASAQPVVPSAPSSISPAAASEQFLRAPVETRGGSDFLVLDPNVNWKTADLGRLIAERQAEHLKRTKNPLNIDFSRCNLDGVDLSFVRLDKARFNGASLKKANLKNAKISGASFEGANLTEAVLTSAQGRKVNFKNANLTDANFKDAFLPRSTFTNANLTKADFSFADLFGSNFQSAVVKDTFFGAAVLGQATFEPLHRYGPQPAKPAFESANFGAANLQGTIFKGVDDSLSTFDVGGRRSIGNVPNPFRRKALDANNERLQWLLNQENWKAPAGLYPEYKPENVAAPSVVIELPVPGKMRQELKEQFREVDPATRAIFAAIETPAGQAALNKFFGTKNYVYRLEDWGIRTQVTGPFSQVRKFYSYENLARLARNPGAAGTGVYGNGASRDGKGTIVRELHIDEAFVKAGLDEAAKRGFEQAKEILKKPGEKESPLDGYELPKMIGVTEFFELSHRRNVKSGGVIETAPGSGEYKLNLAYDAKTNTYVTMADLEFKSIKQHESDLGPVKGRRIVYPGGGYGRLPAGTHLAPEVAQRLTWALKHPAEFVRAGKVNKAENNEPLYRFWVIKPLPEAAAVRNEKVFDDFRNAIQFPSNDAGATYRFDIGANTDPGKAIGKGLGIPTNLGDLLKLLDIDMPVPDLTRHKIEVGFAFKFHGEAKPGTQPPALPPTRP